MKTPKFGSGFATVIVAGVFVVAALFVGDPVAKPPTVPHETVKGVEVHLDMDLNAITAGVITRGVEAAVQRDVPETSGRIVIMNSMAMDINSEYERAARALGFSDRSAMLEEARSLQGYVDETPVGGAARQLFRTSLGEDACLIAINSDQSYYEDGYSGMFKLRDYLVTVLHEVGHCMQMFQMGLMRGAGKSFNIHDRRNAEESILGEFEAEAFAHHLMRSNGIDGRVSIIAAVQADGYAFHNPGSDVVPYLNRDIILSVMKRYKDFPSEMTIEPASLGGFEEAFERAQDTASNFFARDVADGGIERTRASLSLIGRKRTMLKMMTGRDNREGQIVRLVKGDRLALCAYYGSVSYEEYLKTGELDVSYFAYIL